MAKSKQETGTKGKTARRSNGNATPDLMERAATVTKPERTMPIEEAPGPEYPRYRVETGEKIKLSKVDPDESEHYKHEEEALPELQRQRDRISELQERLYAEAEKALLIVLQAMDTGGKDGVGRGVFRGINPQGCNVWSFSAATEEERKHDFLWRFHQKVPERGMIGIFNRSYYEEVLSTRVKAEVPEEIWRSRYEQINEFERILTLNDVTVLKFYMHISKDEQKRRLEERLTNPRKYWLFSENDLKERERWDEHMAAFEDAVNECTTDYAPWYVVPGNKKWYRNLVIARTIADTLEAMDPQFPPLEDGMENVKVPD
jgi:PPK2 family polyphosphate:nucleotide phosphotransferase